jgi:hypothetical protein
MSPLVVMTTSCTTISISFAIVCCGPFSLRSNRLNQDLRQQSYLRLGLPEIFTDGKSYFWHSFEMSLWVRSEVWLCVEFVIRAWNMGHNWFPTDLLCAQTEVRWLNFVQFLWFTLLTSELTCGSDLGPMRTQLRFTHTYKQPNMVIVVTVVAVVAMVVAIWSYANLQWTAPIINKFSGFWPTFSIRSQFVKPFKFFRSGSVIFDRISFSVWKAQVFRFVHSNSTFSLVGHQHGAMFQICSASYAYFQVVKHLCSMSETNIWSASVNQNFVKTSLNRDKVTGNVSRLDRCLRGKTCQSGHPRWSTSS